MLKVGIVGEGKLISNFLKVQLENTGLTQVIAEFHKPTIALTEIPIIKPDVVFLDFEMPGTIELGFKLFNKFTNLEILFVSANNQYAIDVFKLNTIHHRLTKKAEQNLSTKVY